MIKNLIYIFNITNTSIKKLVLWEVLHNFLIAVPSGLLLIIIWELFKDNPSQEKVWLQVLAMAVFFILQLWVSKKAMLNSNTIIYSMNSRIRVLLGDHLQKLSLGFYKKRDPGDLASVILQDVNNFETIFAHSIQAIVAAVFGTVFLSAFLLYLDWKLSVLMLLAIPCSSILIYFAVIISAKFSKNHIESRNNTSSRFIEYIQGIKHLKAFNQTGSRFESLKYAFNKLKLDSIKVEIVPGPFVLTIFIIVEVFFFTMVYMGISRLNSSLSIPAFIAFLILGYRLYEPLKIIIVEYAILRYMNVSVERIISLLKSPIQDSGKNLLPSSFDLEFKNVNFSYVDREVLKDISIKIPENKITALVGASGSGKTTIANLIARFWDTDKGSVSIGGVNVKDMNPKSVCSFISEVFQEVYLFDDSIFNNIKIANPEASDEDIYKAAEKAQVLEFIDSLSDGIDTRVGEAGALLSGGQKQRVSIARAILKDAPIILLDEATSSLDPENEIYIQMAMQELVKNKTVIVIAHKLQSIKNADNIIVLKDGRIEEEGKHNRLIELKGLYSKYWNIQESTSSWKF